MKEFEIFYENKNSDLKRKQLKKKKDREEGKIENRDSEFRNSVKESEFYVLCDPIDSLNTDYDVSKRSGVYPAPNMPVY